MPDDRDVERAIIGLLRQRVPEASICPSEAARALGTDWRSLMPRVRRVAASLAGAGRLRVTHGEREVAADQLETMRGPIRLRRGPGFGAAHSD